MCISCITIFGCGTRRMQRGAAIGAGAGATVGALIGKTAGNVALGTIIGGAVGGTAGAYIGNKMDNALPGEKPDIPGASVSRMDAGYMVNFDKGLLFDNGGTDLTANSETDLKKLAVYLQHDLKTKVIIIGYTDTLDTANYNKDLSLKRAKAVKSILVADSISAHRLITRGKAGKNPAGDINKPNGKAENRQVEIIVISNDKARDEKNN